MTRANARASPGGLSRWPRVLLLGTTALAVAGSLVPYDDRWWLLAIFTVPPGLILAWLATPGEPWNRWLTAGIWLSALSYIGYVAASWLLASWRGGIEIPA